MKPTIKSISVTLTEDVLDNRHVLGRLNYARQAADQLIPIYTDIVNGRPLVNAGDALHRWYIRMMSDPAQVLPDNTHPSVKMDILKALHDEATNILMHNDADEDGLSGTQADLAEMAEDPHIPIYHRELEQLLTADNPRAEEALTLLKDGEHYMWLGGKLAYADNQFTRARVVLKLLQYS